MKKQLIPDRKTSKLLNKELLRKVAASKHLKSVAGKEIKIAPTKNIRSVNGKEYLATAGGKRVSLSVDSLTGNVMKLKEKKEDPKALRGTIGVKVKSRKDCKCGRISMSQGTISGAAGVKPKDEYYFGVCEDCRKVYVYGKVKSISKSLLKLLKAVISTPRTSEGRVDFDSVGAGQSIWITVTKEGPMQGRPMLVTKRPDGDFAITGGASKSAKEKGYFHAALKMKTNKKPLTPEEMDRRHMAKERSADNWKKKRKFVREHQLEIGEQQGEVDEHKNRLWQEFGLSTDKEIQQKMDELHGAVFSKLSTSGYREDDANDIADSVVDTERKRVSQERVDLMKEVEETLKGQGEDKDETIPEEENPDVDEPEDEKPEDEKPEDEKPEDEKPEDEEPEDEEPEEEKPEDEEPEEEEDESDDEEEPEENEDEDEDEPEEEDDEEEESDDEEEPEEDETPPAELEPVDEEDVDDIEVPEAKNDEPLAKEDKKEIVDKLVSELVDKTPANEMKHGKFVDVNLKTKDKRAKVMQLMGHYKNAKDNLRHYKRRRVGSLAEENTGSVTSTSFNSDAKLTDAEAEKLIRDSLGDDIGFEGRQSFYERVADLSRDKDDPEGGFNPYSPFGHLNAHMNDGGLGYRDGGAVRTLNQIAMKSGQNDFMRGELVDALGIQGASELMLSELKKRDVPEEQIRSILDAAAAEVDRVLKESLETDKLLQKNKKAFDDQHGEGYLSDADYNIKVADNIASQQQNIGAALGSLETMGTLQLAMDNGIKDKVTLNAAGDLDKLKNRLARSVSKSASKALRGSKGGKAFLNSKKLSRYMDKHHAATNNAKQLAEIAKGEMNTGDLTIPGVKVGAGQAIPSYRPGQESDLRHIMRQMEILNEEKGTPNSAKTVRTAGLFLNREVGAGKTNIALSAGQMLLNKEPEGSTRTIIHTVPESLLGNWKDESDKVLENPNLVAFGKSTSRKKADEVEEDDGTQKLLMRKEQLNSMVQKILDGKTPRRIVIGQNALQTKVSVRVPGSKAKQVMSVAKALNYTQPLLVSHDEPQNMLTAGKGVLGAAGKEALKLGSKVTDSEGNKLNTVRLALTATPARDRPDQLYDMGNWVTGGAVGTKASFISKNGSLGQGSTTFERSEGDAVLSKLGTQMVSERGKKNHVMKISSPMVKMTTEQKQAQGVVSHEYGANIQRLHDAANGKRFSAGVYKVKMASGWKDKQLDTKEDAAYWLNRTQNAHDNDQAKNLYSKAPGGNWRNNTAFGEASSELDKQERLTPGGSRIIWVRDAGGQKLAQKMLADKYPDAVVTDMFDKKTLEENKSAFTSGKAKYVIMPYTENAGHNMQAAAGSLFIGVPPHYVDYIQGVGRHCRDPRTGDPLISTITYEDSPHDIAQREHYSYQKKFIEGTNYAVRDASSSPMPDIPESPMDMASSAIN